MSIWDWDKPLDAMMLSHDHIAMLAVKHEQQIKDITAHLLELKRLVTPMMEFKPEKSLQAMPAMKVGQGRCLTCGMWSQEFDAQTAEIAAQKEQFRVLEDEMLVMMDERNAVEAALKFAAKLLSREYFSEMNETEMMAYLIKMPKEMK
jgi:predicted sulfurtransferase